MIYFPIVCWLGRFRPRKGLTYKEGAAAASSGLPPPYARSASKGGGARSWRGEAARRTSCAINKIGARRAPGPAKGGGGHLLRRPEHNHDQDDRDELG